MAVQFAIGAIGYVFVVNVLAYSAMVLDKTKAENRSRRIPESTLLNLAIIGGSVGTVLAQQTIRHKTRKEPFRSTLIGILVFQILSLIALIAALVVTGSPDALWQRFALPPVHAGGSFPMRRNGSAMPMPVVPQGGNSDRRLIGLAPPAGLIMCRVFAVTASSARTTPFWAAPTGQGRNGRQRRAERV